MYNLRTLAMLHNVDMHVDQLNCALFVQEFFVRSYIKVLNVCICNNL